MWACVAESIAVHVRSCRPGARAPVFFWGGRGFGIVVGLVPGEQQIISRMLESGMPALVYAGKSRRAGCTALRMSLDGVPPPAEHETKMGGAQRMAYPAVVAAGTDALTIHYGRNDKVLPMPHCSLALCGGSLIATKWHGGGAIHVAQRRYAVKEEFLGRPSLRPIGHTWSCLA
jgi:hypothetical protein